MTARSWKRGAMLHLLLRVLSRVCKCQRARGKIRADIEYFADLPAGLSCGACRGKKFPGQCQGSLISLNVYTVTAIFRYLR